MVKEVSFVSLLQMIQEYISQNYAAALSDKKKLGQLRSYIDKYLNDTGYVVEGFTSEQLSKKHRGDQRQRMGRRMRDV